MNTLRLTQLVLMPTHFLAERVDCLIALCPPLLGGITCRGSDRQRGRHAKKA